MDRFRDRGFWWWVGLGCLVAGLAYAIAGDIARQALWTSFAALAGFWELESDRG